MPVNEEILNNIYGNLSSNSLTDSDYETWKSNFANSKDVQGNVYDYLKSNNLTQSDKTTWTNNVMGNA